MSDNWDFYFANVNEKPASLFVDLGIHETAPDTEKPWLLWLHVYLSSPREDGLSTSEEAEVLWHIEDTLTSAISGSDTIPVGRITTDGRREFYFYGSTDNKFPDAVAQSMTLFPNYKYDFGTQCDPQWTQYFELLHPSPRDRQCMINRHVIEQLQKQGDSLMRERTVFHWAYFADDTSRKQFVAAIRNLGFTIKRQDKVEDKTSHFPLSVSFERVDHVDWNSINQITVELFDLANAYSGDYDGWETSVEKDS